jgi:3-keto-5-aminohexanoate cleavage enzyme
LPTAAIALFITEERMNLLNIRPVPDQLTLNLGTFHFEHKNSEFLFYNSKRWNAEFVKGCKERKIGNELEVYDLSHIQNALDLMDRGVLEPPLHFSFVLGIKGGVPANPQVLMAMLDAIPEGSSWQVVSIGKHQLPLSTMVLAMGGNIRVGMEDNVYYSHGVLAVSNVQLVERAVVSPASWEGKLPLPRKRGRCCICRALRNPGRASFLGRHPTPPPDRVPMRAKPRSE